MSAENVRLKAIMVSSSHFNLEIQKLPSTSIVDSLLTKTHFDSQLSTLSKEKQLESLQAKVDALLTVDGCDDEIVRLANSFIHFDFVSDKLEKAEISFERLHWEIMTRPERISRLPCPIKQPRSALSNKHLMNSTSSIKKDLFEGHGVPKCLLSSSSSTNGCHYS